jgi:hypothetical protein
MRPDCANRLPKSRLCGEKQVTTETKVEAVAITRYHEELSGMVAGPALYEEQTEYVLYADHVSAITALEGEVERLRGKHSDLIARIQSTVTNVAVPKMTESRAEYFKAGARATIAAVNDALTKESP